MPHDRKRYAEPWIQRALAHSGAVGLIGQRQTGKTTLAHGYSSEYATFDRPGMLAEATSNSGAFILDRKRPFAIDECQMCPPLFPAIKEHLRTRKMPGQFLLTGSVRFTSRKAIRESLTGRIVNVETLPLTASEAHSSPLTELYRKNLSTRDWKLPTHFNPCRMNEKVMSHTITGGLPGICFTRSAGFRRAKFETHIETLLDRDLRLIVETTLTLPALLSVLRFLAENQGQAFEWEALRQHSRISVVTLKRLLFALEAIFVVRLLPSEGGIRAPIYYFEDQGTRLHLLGREDTRPLLAAIYGNVPAQIRYSLDAGGAFFRYATRGGASLPLSFRGDGTYFGWIDSPDPSGRPVPSALGSAQSFLKKYRNAKVLIVHPGKEWQLIDGKILSAPVGALY